MQDADSPRPESDATLLPDDLGTCHALIQQLSRTLAEVQTARDDDHATIAALEAYVKKLLQQLFGRRSEKRKFDPKQQVLDFGDDPAATDALREAAAEAEKLIEEYTVRRKARKQPAPPRSEKFAAHLPRVEETVEPPVEEQSCSTHGTKQLIGFDTTETLEFERPKLWVRVRKYPKYVCATDPACGVTQAKRPDGLVEGDRYGTSVATEVVVNKAAYHLPLYTGNKICSAAAAGRPVVRRWSISRPR